MKTKAAAYHRRDAQKVNCGAQLQFRHFYHKRKPQTTDKPGVDMQPTNTCLNICHLVMNKCAFTKIKDFYLQQLHSHSLL